MNSFDANIISTQIVQPAVNAVLNTTREAVGAVLDAYRQRTVEIHRGNDLAEAEASTRLGETFTATYSRLRNPRGGQQ